MVKKKPERPKPERTKTKTRRPTKVDNTHTTLELAHPTRTTISASIAPAARGRIQTRVSHEPLPTSLLERPVRQQRMTEWSKRLQALPPEARRKAEETRQAESEPPSQSGLPEGLLRTAIFIAGVLLAVWLYTNWFIEPEPPVETPLSDMHPKAKSGR